MLLPFTHPIGKGYASKVEAEKMAFLGGVNMKNPATIIIAAFADMDG